MGSESTFEKLAAEFAALKRKEAAYDFLIAQIFNLRWVPVVSVADGVASAEVAELTCLRLRDPAHVIHERIAHTEELLWHLRDAMDAERDEYP